MRTAIVRFRIDFAEHCSVGPGKIALLEGIRRLGSLSQAARELRMSYRYAWLLLDSLNRSFREAVVQSSAGGKAGGGSSLTPFGEKVVSAYREFEQEFTTSAARRFSSLAQMAANSSPRRVMRRRLARPAASARAARGTRRQRSK